MQRLLHTRLHSAGHLIDAAVQLLDLPLKPIKGFHFKQGPYVEYHGEISAEKRESTRLCLEQKINDLVAGEFESRIICAGRNEAMAFCGALPDYIGKAGQDIRLVALVPDIACPCGGTHVKNTKEIGTVTLTKIRVKSGQCRISYSLV